MKSFIACPRCGAFLEPHALACPTCETPVAGQATTCDGLRRCSSCGEEVGEYDDICKSCHQPLPLELATENRPSPQSSPPAAAASPQETCPLCGASSTAESARCAACGASLLVDLVLEASVKGQNVVYTIARDLSALGPPALDFTAMREALGNSQAILAQDATRAWAHQAIELLKRHNTLARACPAHARHAHRRRRRRLLAALAASSLVLLASLVATWRMGWLSAEGLPIALATSAIGAAKDAGTDVSAGSLIKKLRPSLASLKCTESRAAGFFVTEDLMATNAHALCPAGETMTVTLGDGRQLLGEVKHVDEWRDIALLRVVGANVAPPALADAAQLVEGERVVFVGSPFGFDFTVHEGKVSYVGRNLFGTGYIQIDANVNPGNSGGPLLDSQGRVVGVVSMKSEESDNIGFALPINYLLWGEDAFLPQAANGSPSTAWTTLLERVKQSDSEDVAAFRDSFKKPGIVFARLLPGGDSGAVAGIMLRSAGRAPPALDVSLRVQQASQHLCQDVSHISEWESLQLQEDASVLTRQVRWIQKHSLGNDLYFGVARIRPNCFSGRLAGIQVGLDDADARASKVELR